MENDDKKMINAFGGLVKGKRAKLSLRECAKNIGIDYSTLNRIENGENFTIDVFNKIRKWLDVDANYLLDLFQDCDKKIKAKTRKGEK